MRHRFTASIVKEGKWYVAQAVDLGVVSQGKTIEQAQKNLQEAVELYHEQEPKLRRTLRDETPLLTVLEVAI